MVKNIRVLALDIDGVLTDGTAVLSNSGHMGDGEKRFNFQDLDAVAQARRSGLIVALITGEDNTSVDLIAQRFNVDRVKRGAKDKVAALGELSNELGIALDEFCYVGDSDRDAPALCRVGLGLAPANATPTAKASVQRILSSSGGGGAVAEALALILKLRADEHRAATLDVAQALVQAGAALEVADHEGRTPLHRAVGSGRTKIADHLLERGAPVNVADSEGRTPLYLAAAAGRAHTVKRLIELEADPNARDRDGRTPMWAAEAAGHSLVVTTLKRHGGKLRPKRFLGFDLK